MTVNRTQRQIDNRDLTVDEITNHILQMESELCNFKYDFINKQSSEAPHANLSYHNNDFQNVKCHRCRAFGHEAKSCSLIEYGLWFCYACNYITNHIGTEDIYPNKTANGHVNSNKFNENKNFNSSYNKNRGGCEFNVRRNSKNNFKNKGKFNEKNNDKGNYKGRGRGKGFKSQQKANQHNNKKDLVNVNLARNNYMSDVNNLKSTNTNIKFIADSGATNHIINKSIYLHNFKQSSGEFIRSANKNKSSNIVIDGRGDLLLK